MIVMKTESLLHQDSAGLVGILLLFSPEIAIDSEPMENMRFSSLHSKHDLFINKRPCTHFVQYKKIVAKTEEMGKTQDINMYYSLFFLIFSEVNV
ncbi:hypothetical protein E2320_008626 [Naja naja]|nr:hypothetical protein E2320_008626 [Naja naja]